MADLARDVPNNIVAQKLPDTKEIGNENERLLFFTDVIIAIALTLTAVSIHVETHVNRSLLLPYLYSLYPAILTYGLSFFITASYWNEHRRIFSYITRSDPLIIILNLLFLVFIVVLPITHHFYEANVALKTTTIAYYTIQCLVGLCLFLLWGYASQRKHLLAADLPPALRTYITVHLLALPLTFLLYVLLTIFFQPGVTATVAIIFNLAWQGAQRLYMGARHVRPAFNDIRRIPFFSDCVLALAITFTITHIDLPSLGAHPSEQVVLRGLAVSLLSVNAYITTFAAIAIHWFFHYRMFRYITRSDGLLAYLNLAFLFGIVLLFIPGILYTYYARLPLVGQIYYVYQTAIAFLLLLIWLYASYKQRLLNTELDSHELKTFTFQIVRNACIFLVSAVISFFSPITLGFLFYGVVYLLVIFLSFCGSRLRLRRRAQEPQQGAI